MWILHQQLIDKCGSLECCKPFHTSILSYSDVRDISQNNWLASCENVQATFIVKFILCIKEFHGLNLIYDDYDNEISRYTVVLTLDIHVL